MAVSFLGASTLVTTGVATTIAVNIPTVAGGILADDFLVMFVANNTLNIPTVPAGWTLGFSFNAGGSASPAVLCCYKKAVGGESGTQSVTTASGNNRGGMMAFRGVDPTTPIDVAATTVGSASSLTAWNIPSQTTTRPDTAIVYVQANTSTGAQTSTPPTAPTTFTEDYDYAPGTAPSGSAGHLLWAGSGATGVMSVGTGLSVRGGAGAIALRPAAAAAAAAPPLPPPVTRLLHILVR